MTRPAAGLITTEQMRRLHSLLRDHGIVGDVTVHDYLNVWLEEHDSDQHPLESRKDLAAATADRIIRDLDRATPAVAPGGLARALVAVQSELPWVAKTKSATIPGKNGASGFSYTYADLADVTAAAMPVMSKHGLAFLCAPRITESRGYELAGVLLHVSGEEREGALPLHGNDPRALGGAITYMRRYLLGCLLGIVTDDDADGRQAMGHQQTREWDGPDTNTLLIRLDDAAGRAGVTYEQASARWRAQRGDLHIDALDTLDPWILMPLVEAVEKRAAELVAEAAQKAEAEAASAPEASATLPDPADTRDPWATPGTGASGEQPPA